MATGGESNSDHASDAEQYELTEDEEQEQDQEQEKAIEQEARPSDTTERVTGKRKRSASPNDDEEIARRRRRRRSLGYKQSRRSLTLSERKTGTGTAGGTTGAVVHSKQYISDMYSTIIKMSSENKINVKNSWSLHLIDHMEDILHPSKRGAEAGDDNTYNFQKASCTLDASIKIYSYRVDDTWNSSYKILENLSRTEQKHEGEEPNREAEGGATTARKTRKTHARTIEKNLNNINLKAYDTECEADPLFHKMSQLFDEGGTKGMLLANLSVYDGCKILLNSSDVSVVTRKSMHLESNISEKEKEEKDQGIVKAKKASDREEGSDKDQDDDITGNKSLDDRERRDEDVVMEKEQREEEAVDVEMEEPEKEKESSFDDDANEGKSEIGKNDSSSKNTVETTQSKAKTEPAEDALKSDAKDKGDDSSDACKGKKRENEPPVAKERISLSLFGNLSCIDQDVQNLSVCPPLSRMYEQLDELYGDKARHKLGMKNNFLLTTPVKGRRQTISKKDDVTMNLAGIMEEAGQDDSDGEDTAHDTSMDFVPDNADDDGDEDNADTVGEADGVVDGSCADDVEMEKDTAVIDLAKSDEEDTTPEQLVHDGTESDARALDKEASLSSSAAEFFRAKVNENLPANYENNLFSQMIESALVRSATLEAEEGEDQERKNDYSYFDVKMLKNWAGPGYWKFPAFRKIQLKQKLKEETEKDGLFDVDVDLDEDGVAIKAEATDVPADRARKGSSAGVDKKTAMIDFFGEPPDFSRLKAPKSTGTLEVTKGNLKKQGENAQELVLPVDTHIQLDLFFRHFLKDKPRFFKKRVHGIVDGAGAGAVGIKYESGDMVEDDEEKQPFTYNEDSGGFEGGFDEDEEDGISGLDDRGTQSLYSVQGLVQADRVVEKIGVHYERFAKRVDVKKLKGSIWEHLEKKVVKGSDDGDDNAEVNECGKRLRESEADGADGATTFESVVENIADKVPSNVTVSFYFICLLHLANEKGLELVGQNDLRNFQIRKEDI